MLLPRNAAGLPRAWRDPSREDGGDFRKLLPALVCTRIVLARLKSQEGMAFACTLVSQRRTAKCYTKCSLKSYETGGLIWWLPFAQDDQVTLEITLASVKADGSKPLPNLCTAQG